MIQNNTDIEIYKDLTQFYEINDDTNSNNIKSNFN